MTNQEQAKIKLKGIWRSITCVCDVGDKPLPHRRRCYNTYEDFEVQATKIFTRIDSLMTKHTGYKFSVDGLRHQTIDKNHPNIEVIYDKRTRKTVAGFG